MQKPRVLQEPCVYAFFSVPGIGLHCFVWEARAAPPRTALGLSTAAVERRTVGLCEAIFAFRATLLNPQLNFRLPKDLESDRILQPITNCLPADAPSKLLEAEAPNRRDRCSRPPRGLLQCSVPSPHRFRVSCKLAPPKIRPVGAGF